MQLISTSDSNKTFSLYSDGNYFPRAKKSGYGGYIEDIDGTTLIEYSEQIKNNKYAYSFEILGIIRGMQIAKAMGIKKIVSYCDDKTTVQRLHEVLLAKTAEHLHEKNKPELYQQFYDLSEQFVSMKVHYIPREQNKHSDALSRKYSVLMEKNYTRQFLNELEKSEKIFETQEQNNQRLFFSHPNILKMKDKNNPYLIANHRSKLTRKIIKQENENNYQFLYIEVFNNQEQKEFQFKGFHYNKNQKKLLFTEKTSYEQDFIQTYCELLEENLPRLASVNDHIWIYSNSSQLNSIFEQKEKLPKNTFKHFKKAHNGFNHFSKIVFHHFPFEHDFSLEIKEEEEKKENLNNTINSLDELLEQLEQSRLEKDKSKYIGRIIRHHIRKYQEYLKRDLSDIEKNNIIKKTKIELNKKGLLTTKM